MFRSLSRVVVISLVALCFTLSQVPAAQARPQGAAPVARAESGWFEQAMAWLARQLTGEKPTAQMTSATASSVLGSCVDPWGRPIRPCD